jgi:hypothetical protein
MTSIKILHVSAARCHPQGDFWNKRSQAQHANLGIVVEESLRMAPAAETSRSLLLVMSCIVSTAFID